MSRLGRTWLLAVWLVALMASTADAKLPSRVPELTYKAGTCTVVKPNSTLQGDFYPSPVPNSPMLVFVHGGGWIGNRRLEFVTKVRELQAANISVFNIDYCLDSTSIPGAFPMEVEDVEAAARYAIGHAAEYNGDPGDVTLLGGSAGGQLVGMAALNMDAAAPGTVRRVVTLSGPFDFVSLMREDLEGKITTSSFAHNIPKALGCTFLEAKTGGYSSNCTQAVEREWSPVDHVAACPQEWLMFNSEKELIPLAQEEAMKAALTSAGCTFTADVEAGSGHAFAYWNREAGLGSSASTGLASTVVRTITGFVNPAEPAGG